MVWGPQELCAWSWAGRNVFSSYHGRLLLKRNFFKCLLVSWKFYTSSVTHQGSNSSQSHLLRLNTVLKFYLVTSLYKVIFFPK